MKFTIEGFNQEEAVRLGLDVKDLVFLRWFIDFYNTGKMEIHLFEDKQYVWVRYETVLTELPILGINSKDVLARRIRHLEECGLFEFRCFEGAGNRTYFKFKEQALFKLLSNTDLQYELLDPNRGGSYPKVGRVPTQKSEGFLPKSRNPNKDSSIRDSSTNDSSQPGQKTATAPQGAKPVENSKTSHSQRFISKASQGITRGFNIYQMTNRFYRERKLNKPLPETVLEEVLDKFLSNGNEVKDLWPYFLHVLYEKSREYFSDMNQREGENLKKQPAILGTILRGMAFQGEK